MAVPNLLRRRADQLSMSCSRLAKVCGFPVPTVKGWLRGAYCPREKSWPKLARALHVSHGTLVKWLAEMHSQKQNGLKDRISEAHQIIESKKRWRKMRPSTRKELKEAVEAYKKAGGKITKLKPQPASLMLFWGNK